MSNDSEQVKIGAGHASAMARMGLRELRGAMYPESNVAQQAEYGLYGTLTPGEVAESRRDESGPLAEDYDRGEEPGSVLDSKIEQARSRELEPSHDDRDMERN